MHTFTSCEYVDNYFQLFYNTVVNTSLINACSFFGHRQIEVTDNLIFSITETVENLIKTYNCDIFLFGGFGEFDELCLKIVSLLKQSKYPNIKRVYCCTDEKDMRRKKKSVNFCNLYDEITYTPLIYNYWYTRIYYRNLEIIKNSKFSIFYVTNTNNSGASKIYEFAKKQHIYTINLANN